MEKAAIATTGLPNSGKTTATRILSKQLDVDVLSVGDQVRQHARVELGDNVDTQDIGEWLWQQYSQFGRHIFPRWMISTLQQADIDGWAVVDGLRAPETYSVLEARFDKVVVVEIRCGFDERLQRMMQRGRDGEDEYGETHLRQRESRDRQYGIEAVRQSGLVDHRIVNTGSKESFLEDVVTVSRVIETNLSRRA